MIIKVGVIYVPEVIMIVNANMKKSLTLCFDFKNLRNKKRVKGNE